MTRPLIVVQTNSYAAITNESTGSHFLLRSTLGVSLGRIEHVDSILKGDFDDFLMKGSSMCHYEADDDRATRDDEP